MKRLIAILICAIAVTMCETTNGDKVYPTGKTVIYYATITDYCHPTEINYIDSKVEDGKLLCQLYVGMDYIASILDVIEQNDNADRYIEMQAVYKDYPKHPIIAEHWTVIGWKFNHHCCVIIDNLVGIEITALENWSENYPKGSDLSGIFTFSYQSPKAYIESGFTTDMDETFTCKVDEISTSPIELLRCGMTYLTTTELPTAERPYVNIKYYFSNGDILECQTLSNFGLP